MRFGALLGITLGIFAALPCHAQSSTAPVSTALTRHPVVLVQCADVIGYLDVRRKFRKPIERLFLLTVFEEFHVSSLGRSRSPTSLSARPIGDRRTATE